MKFLPAYNLTRTGTQSSSWKFVCFILLFAAKTAIANHPSSHGHHHGMFYSLIWSIVVSYLYPKPLEIFCKNQSIFRLTSSHTFFSSSPTSSPSAIIFLSLNQRYLRSPVLLQPAWYRVLRQNESCLSTSLLTKFRWKWAISVFTTRIIDRRPTNTTLKR